MLLTLDKINFSPMTNDDLAAYLRKSIPEYAYDQVQAGNWSSTEAINRSRAEFDQMIPQGLETPNAVLVNVLMNAETKIGMMWYYIDPEKPVPTIYLLDFFLFPQFKSKGLEKSVLNGLEDAAKAGGARRIELQIFAHRANDLKMYLESGFSQTSILLAKNFQI